MILNESFTQGRFGVLVRKYRLRRGITQKQLADLSTVSIRAIRDLELSRSRRPRRDTVQLVADGLGLGDWERARLEAAADFQPSPSDLRELFGTTVAAPPSALDPLIGRSDDVAALSALVTGGHLVTVVGPCGVGKTRTALAVAQHLHQTDLLPVLWRASATATPGHWRPTIGPHELSALLRTELNSLADPDVGAYELAEVIGDRAALLVLDDLAAVGCDSVLTMLRGCRKLRVLATARTALGVQGEHTFHLGPLAVPPDTDDTSPAELARVESVQLFARYAVHSQPSFMLTEANTAVVAQICRLLDGIPVALEAAATWLLVVSPRELLDQVLADPFELGDGQMDDLREAIRHALSRLSDIERSVFHRLTGTWAVTDITELTGWPPITCARLARRLLTLGLAWQDPDSPILFHTLELGRRRAVRKQHKIVGTRQTMRTRAQYAHFPAERPVLRTWGHGKVVN